MSSLASILNMVPFWQTESFSNLSTPLFTPDSHCKSSLKQKAISMQWPEFLAALKFLLLDQLAHHL
jgi:hypothetical protein